MPGHKVAFLVLATSAAFGTIRFLGKLNFVAYCFFPALVTVGMTYSNVAYPFGSALNERAERFRKSWQIRGNIDGTELVLKPRAETREIVGLMRSCRDLKMKVADFYNLEKSTVITFNGLVASNTFGLLIVYKAVTV